MITTEGVDKHQGDNYSKADIVLTTIDGQKTTISFREIEKHLQLIESDSAIDKSNVIVNAMLLVIAALAEDYLLKSGNAERVQSIKQAYGVISKPTAIIKSLKDVVLQDEIPMQKFVEAMQVVGASLEKEAMSRPTSTILIAPNDSENKNIIHKLLTLEDSPEKIKSASGLKFSRAEVISSSESCTDKFGAEFVDKVLSMPLYKAEVITSTSGPYFVLIKNRSAAVPKSSVNAKTYEITRGLLALAGMRKIVKAKFSEYLNSGRITSSNPEFTNDKIESMFTDVVNACIPDPSKTLGQEVTIGD